jgi:hypothetical protein
MTGLAASSRTSSSPGSRTRAGTMASAAGSPRNRSKHQKGITSIDTDRYRTAPRGRTTRQSSPQWLPLALVICAHTEEVTGSIPVSPTNVFAAQIGCVGLSVGSVPVVCHRAGSSACGRPGPAALLGLGSRSGGCHPGELQSMWGGWGSNPRLTDYEEASSLRTSRPPGHC